MTSFSVFEMILVARCFIPHVAQKVQVTPTLEGYDLQTIAVGDDVDSCAYGVTEHMISAPRSTVSRLE